MKKFLSFLYLIAFSLYLVSTGVFAAETTGTISTDGLEWSVDWLWGIVIETPVADPTEGTYTSTKYVELSTPSSQENNICYTTNNVNPECGASSGCDVGTVFSSDITVSSSTTIKAIACYALGNESPVKTFTYTIKVSTGWWWGGGWWGGGMPVCQDDQLVCENGKYQRAEWVIYCYGWNLYESCDTTNTGSVIPTTSTSTSTWGGGSTLLYDYIVQNIVPNKTFSGATISSGSIDTPISVEGQINFDNVDNGTVEATWSGWLIVIVPYKDSDMTLIIPENTTITWPADWDGTLTWPITKKQLDDYLASLINIGGVDLPLDLSNPAQVVIDTPVAEWSIILVYISEDWENIKPLTTTKVENGQIVFETDSLGYFILINRWMIYDEPVILDEPEDNIAICKSNVSFTDMKPGDFAYDYIIYLAERCIVHWFEERDFRPADPISRIEFLKIALRSMEIDSQEYDDINYIDLSADWMEKYTDTAKKLWIINEENRFIPDEYITRIDAMEILLNTIVESKWLILDTSTTATVFSDLEDQTDIWYVNALRDLLIVDGQTVNGELVFRPGDTITRAEVSKIIYNAMRIQSNN